EEQFLEKTDPREEGVVTRSVQSQNAARRRRAGAEPIGGCRFSTPHGQLETFPAHPVFLKPTSESAFEREFYGGHPVVDEPRSPVLQPFGPAEGTLPLCVT